MRSVRRLPLSRCARKRRQMASPRRRPRPRRSVIEKRVRLQVSSRGYQKRTNFFRFRRASTRSVASLADAPPIHRTRPPPQLAEGCVSTSRGHFLSTAPVGRWTRRVSVKCVAQTSAAPRCYRFSRETVKNAGRLSESAGRLAESTGRLAEARGRRQKTRPSDRNEGRHMILRPEIASGRGHSADRPSKQIAATRSYELPVETDNRARFFVAVPRF